jgi:outer membrane protein
VIGRLLAAPALALALAASTPAQAQQGALTLEAALALARDRSPDVAGAAALARGAAGSLRIARSLGRPRVGIDAFHLHFDDAPTLLLGELGAVSPIPTSTSLVRVGVLQPIYTGGRVSALVQAAEWGERGAAAAWDQTDVEVSAAVAHGHDAALLAEALLAVAEEGVRVLRAAVEVAEEQYAAGVVARLDVLQAETRLVAAERELRAASDAVVHSREVLSVLIGLDPASAPAAAGKLEPVEVSFDSATVAELVLRASGRRPDLEALAAGARAADARSRAARAAVRPSASVYLGGLAMRPELLSDGEGWATNLVAGLLVTWPLFDFGGAAGEAEVARAEAGRLDAEARRRGQAAVVDLRAQLRNLARAELDIDAGHANVKRAERALGIARERYAEGVGIQLEVLATQSDLAGARAALLSAIHVQRGAAIELRRAAGLPADAGLAIPTERP